MKKIFKKPILFDFAITRETFTKNLKITFRVGSLTFINGFYFAILPSIFIQSLTKGIVAINLQWLFWGVGVMFEKKEGKQ